MFKLWYIKHHAAIRWKANGGVEIKKSLKKFKIKFDKRQTCAKLNNTLQFAMRIKAS